MKKTTVALASLLIMVLFTSARYTTPADVRIGYQAPSLALTNDGGSMSLAQLRGSYVIVTFWTSAQPQSRIDNLAHDRLAAANDNLHHISVNIDRSEGLWNTLKRCDSLDENAQFYLPDDRQETVLKAWRQNADQFSSVLVDPDGVVIAINPTIDELKQI